MASFNVPLTGRFLPLRKLEDGGFPGISEHFKNVAILGNVATGVVLVAVRLH